MNSKKILIITPFFAPQSHAAVFRAHKLVKYLKKEGWDPIVLTVKTNYNHNEDPALLEELKGVPIYKTSYIEPTFRGLYMWLSKKDRTFKTLKKNKENKTEKQDQNVAKLDQKQKPLLKRFYNFVLEHYLQNPDRFWTWKLSAVRMAKRIIKEENIKVIYTSCLPLTTNQIGIQLKKETDVKWIADFRDPVTYAKRMYSALGKVYLNQKKIQDDTFLYADKVTVLSSAYELIFHDQYEGKYNHKIEFIPTGLDDEYLPNPVTEKSNTLLFIGEYLEEYKDYFFKLYKEAIDNLPYENIPTIQIIGNKEINTGVALPYLQNLKLERQVEFIDHLPQKDLYKYVEKANYVLLIGGTQTLWWCNFAKLVDYIALKKQVIAMIPDISEARSELTKAGLGVFIKENKESIQKLKKLFMNRDDNFNNLDEAYCKRYLASRQTKAFITLFQELAE